MSSFLSYLRKADPKMYTTLSRFKPGSSGFDAVWKQMAKSNPRGFEAVQHGFIKSSHYDPAAKKIKSSIGFDASKYPIAVQNALWSTAVQHGAGGATNVFRNAGIRMGMSAAEIIKRVYNERMAGNGTKYFSRSSSSIRKSVVNRFRNEMNDALRMLG